MASEDVSTPAANGKFAIFRKEEITKKPVLRNKAAKILPDILQCIGNTPLVRLNKIPKEYGIQCEMVVKCEFLNPCGSVKDRIALQMIEAAENEMPLADRVLIEATSGNTGSGLALVSAVKGYRLMLAVRGKAAKERVDLMRALGAEVIVGGLHTNSFSRDSHMNIAKSLSKQTLGGILVDQYSNLANPLAHYRTTAEEILDQCDGKVDMIVMGVGTGGTITGISHKFKEKCPDCEIIGVDPYGSILADPTSTGRFYELEAIGQDFIPYVMDTEMVDTWYKVGDKESFMMARELIRKEGLLCGGSSGAAIAGALKAAKHLSKDQRCVVILPDGVHNYVNKFLCDKWMIEKGFIDVDSVMSAKHWWWDQKVSTLEVAPAVTALSHLLCKHAMEMMKSKRCDQLMVINDTSNIEGMLSLSDILTNMVDGKAYTGTCISKMVNKIYPRVPFDVTLGRLAMVLEKTQYAVIVHDQPNCPKDDLRTIVGIITYKDFLSYIASGSKN